MSVGGTVIAPRTRGEGEKPVIRNLSIMASAGSGKTYQLSSRFLQIVFLGAEPGSILASTFTRVAAGEIRDRILQRLAEAADDDKKRAELGEAIERKKMSRDEAVETLARLTRNLHRLNVRTLDSFFAQVVRCFALELGIDPAAQVVDAALDNEMRREAIEMMLDERDPQPLIDLLRVLADGTESRRVSEVIDEEMRALYEVYREAPPEAWEAVKPWKQLDHDELQDAIEHLVNSPPSSDGRFIRAHTGDCELARAARRDSAEDWRGFIGRGLAKAIVFNGGEYHGKPIEGNVLAAYEPLIDHARAVIRNAIVGRTRSTFALLERLHTRYEESKARHKAMTFADVTAKMARALANGSSRTADDICFRLDATLRHIMLDEMQDTSVQQWHALAEIVRNIISEPPPERSFFCVGDVKQSIFGWREANPEILAQMPNLLRDLGGSAEQETLPQNWRSSRIVLEAVDQVFEDTRSNTALASLPYAIHEWGGWGGGEYERHEAKRDLPGYVELRTCRLADRSAGEDQSVVRLSNAADLIDRLHRQSPDRSIGVLTRTNETVSCLMYELGPSQRNLNAAGRGGGSLTDAAAVNAVLDLLQLADHPEHTVAAFNVVHSPLGEAIGFTDLNQRSRIARLVRRLLLDHGYAKTIGRWIEQIGDRCDARELRRLVQLQQLAGRFEPRAALRTRNFLALVEQTVIPDSGAAPIQVMTIHQAKGLEFDIVVLPDLDKGVAQIGKLKLIVERDPCGNITRVARHLGKEAWGLFDDLATMFDQHITRVARDSLSTLYVAMTRAKHALHMVINPSKEKERQVPKTLAGMLRCGFVGEDRVDPETVLYAHGEATWHERIGVMQQTEQDKEAVVRACRIELAPATGEVPRGRSAASASQETETDEIRDDASPDFTFRIHSRAARERGTAIHRMFETVEWIEDYTPDRAALMRIAREVAPRRGEVWPRQQVDAFLDMLKSPAVQRALSRDEADGGQRTARLWREVPYARLVNGEIRQGVIDRLTTYFDEQEKCIGATVLDYKTDRFAFTGNGPPDAAALSERAEHHRPQLEAYRSAAAAVLGLDEPQIALKLLFTDCGEVVRLR